MRGWMAALLIFLLLLAAFSCPRPEYSTGEQVYEGECAKCHKLRGKGGTKGPDLTDVFPKKDESYIRNYTLDPRSLKGDGIMPPSELTDRELDLVVHYIKEKGHSQRR